MWQKKINTKEHEGKRLKLLKTEKNWFINITTYLQKWNRRHLLFLVTLQPLTWLKPPLFMYLYHTKLDTYTHTHTIRTPLKEWSACPTGRYLQNTPQKQKTNIYAVSGIRTHDPNSRIPTDLRLWLHVRRDRWIFTYLSVILAEIICDSRYPAHITGIRLSILSELYCFYLIHGLSSSSLIISYLIRYNQCNYQSFI
jgi:hypothetical protein